ncbi:hybrid sensor histidine kinase/response regulator [Desulfobacula sp.]|uniref:hybrid sensor histidine kinase/response regulator n=1 Tax=Desulfobacula sp. TaxID=2593537 RepID=UPI0026330A32|nr:hybrid sensor histidine kinase/response regulator [Desulfobacula sp.]
MSNIEDKEIFNDFIEEALDHLDGIEDDLLSIEEAGVNFNEEIVNKVFRAVHTIKGGAGYLGLKSVEELAHNSENVMAKIRAMELIPTPGIISTLLDAMDTLSTLINRHESSNEIDISSNLSSLKAICLGDAPQENSNPENNNIEKKTSPVPVSSESATMISTDDKPASENNPVLISSSAADLLLKVEPSVMDAFFEQGSFLYVLQYNLLNDSESTGKDHTEILEELKETGDVLATNIDEDVSVELIKENGCPLFVLFAAILEKDLMENFFDINPDQIQLITPDDLEQAALPPSPLPRQAQPVESGPDSTPSVLTETVAVKTMEKPNRTPLKDSLAKAEQKPDNLRVNVRLLDSLMTLAGELVLTRNQLVQAVSSRKVTGIDNISQRLNLVTSELQEAIMSTRMQPVGNVFNKFKRIVRDFSKNLGKKINLIVEGEEVELDKTIIESIGDPLTHLVRNSIDHGIEMPEERIAAQKPETGILRITAYHEGGQVMIAIEDDGAGINIERVKEKVLTMGLRESASLDELSDKEIANLIFLPGMSTAKEITDISGRGVGMDVVNTNISKVGGTVNIDTTPGKGSMITIKLPLTLAIIPSLIISVQKERYAIPQVNMVELVRIPAAKVKERIEKIGSAIVMRLRGELLPLIKLTDALGIEDRYYASDDTGEQFPDKRTLTEDRRQAPVDKIVRQVDTESIVSDPEKRAFIPDRRTSPMSAYNILVVSVGDYHYGLIVDQVLDSEEIVVKPVGTHLRDCECYAGASVQGDGKVALILDIIGISKIMNLRTVSKSVQEQAQKRAESKIVKDTQSFLLVCNAPDEQIAIPLDLISRIELCKIKDIKITGGRKNIQYRGGPLPLFSLDEVADVGSPKTDSPTCYIIVFSISGKEVGIIMSEIIDIIRGTYIIDEMTHKQPGIMGSTIINEEITLLADLYGVIDTIMPEWTKALKSKIKEDSPGNILVVEDSPFFLHQVVSFLSEIGYKPLTATDGVQGLEVLNREKIDIVLTDIEMPNMNGLEMTRKIRADERFKNLPIIAVTSLAGDAAEKEGRDAGINDYLVKLDREKIISCVKKYLV